MPRQLARRTLENALRREGFRRVAGVDEVGRGCLAGPVMAGAVILDPARPVSGLADSKLLTARAREQLFDLITARADAWAVGVAEADEIDRYNIRQASLLAMQRAVRALAPVPDALIVDAVRIPDVPMPQYPVVGADRTCAAVAAASIVAKVVRDRRMRCLHEEDPRFGHARHKGYGTAEHLAAVARFGWSVAHRRSFRPATLFDTILEA